jgi:hypothetical protein
VRFSHQRLTLWYGTADAPAPPENGIEARRGASVTVAVQPCHPCNTVTVRYRVDEGLIHTVRAVRIRTDFTQRVEYHRASFPDFWSGERVDYLPILSCSGRVAPDPKTAITFPSSFRIGGELHAVARVPLDSLGQQRSKEGQPSVSRQPFSLDYLASVKVPLKGPETIGVTPEGILVNWYWYPAEGMVTGPKLNAKVRQFGGDWMTIRRDGVGVMDVRATLETGDGALIFVNYLGHYELGPNGYQDFLDGRWPERAPTRTTPRFHTAHPSYVWLNRLQCIGIGEVRMRELSYTYDLYALR